MRLLRGDRPSDRLLLPDRPSRPTRPICLTVTPTRFTNRSFASLAPSATNGVKSPILSRSSALTLGTTRTRIGRPISDAASLSILSLTKLPHLPQRQVRSLSFFPRRQTGLVEQSSRNRVPRAVNFCGGGLPANRRTPIGFAEWADSRMVRRVDSVSSGTWCFLFS